MPGFVVTSTWHSKLWKYAWPKPFCCTEPVHFQFPSSNCQVAYWAPVELLPTGFTQLLWRVIHNYHMLTTIFWWLIFICSTCSHSHICSFCLAQSCTLVPYIAILRKKYYFPYSGVTEICILFGDNPGKINRTSMLLKNIRMQFTSLNDQPVFLLSNYTHIIYFKPCF